MRIVVSGIASDIGFNCGRILRELDSVDALFGIDIHADHPGNCLFEQCVIAPRATDPEYERWLSNFLKENRIDFFLPTSEAEIACLSEGRLSDQIETQFIMANSKAVDHALDKHKCLTFLCERSLQVPAHGLVGLVEPDSWPVVIKPRSGQGSKGVVVVENMEDYRQQATAGAVWQELLLPDNEEYTCPVYRSPAAGVRVLVLCRTLQGGLTGRGEVVDAPEIADYVRDIAEAMDLRGAMNVQLRLTSAGPRLFEINPRLSSTVMFRHRLGFTDLNWWLMELAGRRLPDYEPVTPGTRFYRGSQEYFIQPPAGSDKAR